MLNHCCCIAVVSKQSDVTEAIRLLHEADIDSSALSVLSKKTDSTDIDTLLTDSGVPEGSRYCYRCVLETGLTLCVVQGDSELVEAAGDQLEKIDDVEISIHLDIPHKGYGSDDNNDHPPD